MDTPDRRDDLISSKIAKGNLRNLINAKCIECIYDPSSIGAGTWTQQVTDCTSTICPLYSERPLATEANNIRKQEKFNKMTPKQQESYRKKQDLASKRIKETLHK